MSRAAHLWPMLLLLGGCGAALAAPRLTPLAPAERSASQSAIVDEFAGAAGMANAVATYVRNEVLARHILPFQRYVLSATSLAARQRELVGLRTVWLARSDYLWAHRVPAARRAGLTAEEIRRVALGPDAPGWMPLEAALLRAVDELRVDSFVGNSTWAELARELDTRQLIEVAFTVGEITMVAGTVNSLAVEIESGLADRLPVDVPHAVAAVRTHVRLVDEAPRIPPLEPPDWSAEVRELLDPSGSGRRVANVYRTYAHHPALDRLRRGVSEHIRDATTLSDRQREILLLRIGALCRSEYEWVAHERIGRQAGLTDTDLARIVAGPGSGADPLDDALLRATDELYYDDVVSEATWAELAAAFDARQLLDVLTAIGGYRMFSMAMNSFGVQLDPGSSRFPPELRSPGSR